MSPVTEAWVCTGTRYKHMRTGALSTPFTDTFAFTPKAAKQGGLVSVDPTAMGNYSALGPSGYVLKVGWDDIERGAQGVYTWSTIDSALAAYPGKTMTLRIQAGGSAPGWLKTATGGIFIQNNQLGLSTTIAHFWEDVALTAWDAMIRAAGARYDSNPRVVLVSSDEAMTLYSEPLILGGHDPSAIAMFNAGLNKDTHRQAMLDSTLSTCEAFPSTLVEFAGHSDWQQATATGVRSSWPDARALLNELCTTWGNQLVITDYGLDSTDFAASFPAQPTATASSYYRWMRGRKAEGGRIGFQLTLGAGQTHTGLERRDGAQNAADFGGDYVEHSSWGTISNDGTVTNGSAEITRLDAALKTNAGV